MASSLTRGLLLLVAGACIGWPLHAWLGPSPEGDEDAPELSPDEMDVRVTTAEVVRGELPIVVVAAGVVRTEPAGQLVLSSRAGGRVLETPVARNQVVRQGDLLLRFDALPLELAVQQARAELAQAADALAEYERSGRETRALELQSAAQQAASRATLLEAQATRTDALHAEGLASDKALAEAHQAASQARTDQTLAERAAAAFTDTSAELQHATLAAAQAAAEANLHDAESRRAEAEVRAPRDGQLVELFARPGQSFDPGAPLGELLVPEARVIAFGVAAARLPELQLGAPATWDDAQGTPRRGTLARLGGSVDATSGLIEAVVQPDADTPPAPPGLALRGELELRRLHDVLLVPERAVLRADDVPVVVLADGGHARRVPVDVAGRHGGLAAIEGDVQPGQRVVIDGGYNLPDGARLSESPPGSP